MCPSQHAGKATKALKPTIDFQLFVPALPNTFPLSLGLLAPLSTVQTLELIPHSCLACPICVVCALQFIVNGTVKRTIPENRFGGTSLSPPVPPVAAA